MQLTQDQMTVLDNYFNAQENLPVVVAEIAAAIRDVVSPENPAAPVEDASAPAPVVEDVPAPAPVVEDAPAPAPVVDAPVTPTE